MLRIIKLVLILGILGILGLLGDLGLFWEIGRVYAVYNKEGTTSEATYAPREVIVKYKTGETPESIIREAREREERGSQFFGRMLNKWESYRLQIEGRQLPEDILRKMREVEREFAIKRRDLLFDRYYIIKVERNIPVSRLLSAFRAQPNVELAEPNYVYKTLAVPDDPIYPQMWGLEKIKTEQAWDQTTGAAGIKAAIVDAGIDSNHEDLATNVAAYRDFAGCSYYTTGHGTHTAGTVGAAGNNGIGVVGVNWQVGLVLANAGCSDALFTSHIVSGINWAVEEGARVINLSLGGSVYSNSMAAAIGNAVNLGTVVVASAGNDGSPSADTNYPASDPKVITVSAVGAQDELARYSSYGNSVDVSAPGGNPPNGSPSCSSDGSDCIFSAWPNNDYIPLAGTSMAAPHVAGLAALILAKDSGLTVDQVKQYIYESADDLGAAGWDNRFGHGRINAAAALAAVPGSVTPSPTQSPTPTTTPTSTPTPLPSFTPSPTPTLPVSPTPTDFATPTPTTTPTLTTTPILSPTDSGVTPTSTVAPTDTPASSPTGSPVSCSVDGDYNGDGSVDGTDFADWRADYLSDAAPLSCFEYWRRASFGFESPTDSAGTPAVSLTPDGSPSPTDAAQPTRDLSITVTASPTPAPCINGNVCTFPGRCPTDRQQGQYQCPAGQVCCNLNR